MRGPCRTELAGFLVNSFCPDCDHVITAHGQDGVCTVCEHLDELHAAREAAEDESAGQGIDLTASGTVKSEMGHGAPPPRR